MIHNGTPSRDVAQESVGTSPSFSPSSTTASTPKPNESDQDGKGKANTRKVTWSKKQSIFSYMHAFYKLSFRRIYILCPTCPAVRYCWQMLRRLSFAAWCNPTKPEQILNAMSISNKNGLRAPSLETKWLLLKLLEQAPWVVCGPWWMPMPSKSREWLTRIKPVLRNRLRLGVLEKDCQLFVNCWYYAR